MSDRGRERIRETTGGRTPQTRTNMREASPTHPVHLPASERYLAHLSTVCVCGTPLSCTFYIDLGYEITCATCGCQYHAYADVRHA